MLDELFEERKNLEEKIENFFGGDPNPHHGGRGYQDLLESLDNVNEQIAFILEDDKDEE